ncbi:zinc finger protein 521-like [Diorhabda sublineata]|uniref:zinc finger protein 521-like n=1 Tax=Diorhabda sublineata TaxID=1163346 RepID=UPI0024E17C89|nr:zinc finger protein 521-like [Diorhabda sublineata]
MFSSMYCHTETKKVSAWKEDNWWEPCITKVTPYSLLPDTICGECAESVDAFYMFIKNCIQNIIILEAQYDIQESCLKSKQKRDKSCFVDFSHKKINRGSQTDDSLDVLFGKNFDIDEFRNSFPHTTNYLSNPSSLMSQNEIRLVDYDIDSESSLDEHFDGKGEIILCDKLQSFNKICKLVDSYTNRRVFPTKTNYFDDTETNLISEISQRKNLKRKNEFIETYKPKIYKLDTSNRRKNKIPKKLDTQDIREENFNRENLVQDQIKELTNGEREIQQNTNEKLLSSLPQSCLLCDTHFSDSSALASHVFEFHGIDMSEVVSSGSGESLPEKGKKKLPKLVKISDLKKTDSIEHNQSSEHQQSSKLSCPNCSGVFTSKQDLMMHLRLKHAQIAGFVCGICLHQCSSYMNLKTHLENCSNPQPNTKYICQICRYGDDNFKWLENHVLVHDFIIETCKKQMRMFDPEDFIVINEAFADTPYKGLSCVDCGQNEFFSFKEFSAHRRNEHSNFHCDLCNKFYGRNSHLWKHVNRLHKGHPSITCQLCYKTSASKYHLSQHFNKIHLTKSSKKSMNQSEKQTKFPFDYSPLKPKFIKDEFDYRSDNSNINFDEVAIKEESDEDSNNIKDEPPSAPKEIDSSHDMYTNIITNYTPPLNDGDFKCPKCSKGFHKKMLLKKHKKNCRPRMQKDLLTRCKTCARIFKDRQSLAKHLVNYHSEYTCEICTEKVESKCEIVSHIRFRHPGCPLFCRICKNVLRSKSDLQEHTRNHFDSHVCQFCGDSLPSKIKLKMHILSLHRKILSLSCGICLKLFENQHILRDHVKLIHKNQLTPLTSCPVCGKNYGSKWKTYDHINKSHGRIFRACKTCLEIFDNDAQLQAHCDVTAHGGPVGNSNTAALRNSIMAHIKSAIDEVVEQNDEINDDSDSDDEGESDGAYKKQQIEETKFYLPQNDKISLLEKRLLGKTITDDETNIKPKQTITNSNKKIKISNNETKSKTTNKKEDESDGTNPQTNSSKRTVYVNSNDPSYCEICYKTWPAKKHLWQHYIRCHKSVAATVCGICLKTNDNYKALQHHLRDNHPKLLHGQGFGSNFICRICGRYHNASSKLRLHMVIHENFDWKLLDEDKSDNDINPKSTTNGFKFTKGSEREEYDDNINYESLIEQVECSSQSENEESENDQPDQLKQEVSSSTEDQEEASEDSVLSSNSIQDEIDKKIPISTEQETSQRQDCHSSEDSSTTFSDDSKSDSSDDCSQASQSMSSQSKFNPRSNSNTADSSISSNIFERKPEELDSAIKSISYECIQPEDLNVVDDYCDLQNNCLNENEIESAVGSIL